MELHLDASRWPWNPRSLHAGVGGILVKECFELLGPIRNYVLLYSNVRTQRSPVNALVIELSVVHAGLVELH